MLEKLEELVYNNNHLFIRQKKSDVALCLIMCVRYFNGINNKSTSSISKTLIE